MAVIGWASANLKIMSKQTAVEFLAERYNYITWMRNRDEISPSTADEWRAKFLKEAKEMEKEQIIKAHLHGVIHKFDNPNDASDNYYNDTFVGVV
jgi:anaerobic ribonucleoside-triphosphate reductase